MSCRVMSLRCRAVCSAVSIWEWNRVALLLSSLITAYRAIERPRTVSKRLTEQRSEEKRGSSWEIKSISISIQSPSIVDFTWNKKTKKKWSGRFQVIGDKNCCCCCCVCKYATVVNLTTAVLIIIIIIILLRTRSFIVQAFILRPTATTSTSRIRNE